MKKVVSFTCKLNNIWTYLNKWILAKWLQVAVNWALLCLGFVFCFGFFFFFNLSSPTYLQLNREMVRFIWAWKTGACPNSAWVAHTSASTPDTISATPPKTGLLFYYILSVPFMSHLNCKRLYCCCLALKCNLQVSLWKNQWNLSTDYRLVDCMAPTWAFWFVFLSLTGNSVFFFRPSTDWLRPSHIMEGHLFTQDQLI
jgi:hypothetical protein